MDYLYYCLVSFTTCLAVLFTVTVSYIEFLHRKYSHIPGPARTSFFSGNTTQYTEAARQGTPRCHLQLEWAKKYGKTYVVWLYHAPLLITADPRAVKEFLTSGKHFKSAIFYSSLGNLFGMRTMKEGLGLLTDEAKWRHYRKIFDPVFHGLPLRDMVVKLNDVLDEMMDYLGTVADGQTTIKIGPLLNRMALDFVMKAAFGRNIKSMKNEVDPFTIAVQQLMEGAMIQTYDPLLKVKFWKERNTKERSWDAVHLLRSEGKHWLVERKEALQNNTYVPNDLLTVLAQASRDAEHEDGDEIAIDNIVNFIMGGQETVANVLGFAILELHKHPDIAKLLWEEIDEIIGTKSIMTMEEVGQLDLAGRVVMETLRLYPVSPHTFRDVCTDDCEIAGMRIPRGTIVDVSQYVTHHLPEHCPEGMVFNPDRFKPGSNLRSKRRWRWQRLPRGLR